MPVSPARKSGFLGPMLKLFSSSVMDQVVLSIANFGVGFILIRLTTDNDYGLYILVLTAQQLATAVQSSWLGGPLSIVMARKSPEERRSTIGAVKDAQRSWLLKVLLLAQGALLMATALQLLSFRMALLLAVALLSTWAALRRELLRTLLLLFSRTHTLLTADALFAVVLVTGALAATLSHGAAVVWALGALLAAALAGEALAHRRLGQDPGWVGGDASAVFREVRSLGLWSTLGALTYWLYSSASNYLLAGLVDLKAVADVNATRLLLMPPIMMTVGVQALMVPTASLWYAQVGLTRLTRRLVAFTVGMVALDLVYLAVIWLARDWLTGSLMHKQIAQRDELLMLWAGVAIVGVVRDVMQCALFALGRMKSMAGQGMLCAAVSLVVTLVGVRWWSAAAGLIGQIAGELINLVGIILLLREAHRSAPARSAAESA